MNENRSVQLLLLACLLGFAAPGAIQVTGEEPIVGGPCEGCEAVFVAIPDELSAQARIAPAGEPGEPLRIVGQVVHRDGTPASGTIVYAYHTDDRGIYPPDPALRGTPAYRHGSLRSWVRTGADGRYGFDTIRPAGYPSSETPQHVHMHVIEPSRCTYWIDSIHFTDDPRLTQERLEQAPDAGRGGGGLVTPRRDEDGVWIVERDIALGHAVPGYSACAR